VLARRVVRRSFNAVARLSSGLGRRAAAIAEELNVPTVSHPENVQFKDLHLGRRAFVIGNGPSLAGQDISALKGELLFTMNSFDRHPLCRELRPLYHSLADPAENSNDVPEEANLAKIADGIGESPVFIPAWPSIDSAVLQKWRSAGQLWTVPMYGSLADGPVRVFDMCVGFPGVQSTSQLAIMAAVYMGCNPIYLIGLDTDWAASSNLDRHFYGEPTLDETWDSTEYDEHWSYQRILESTLALFKGYTNLREYCRSRNVEVYNCTAGGLLDVFPRKRFEDVIADG